MLSYHTNAAKVLGMLSRDDYLRDWDWKLPGPVMEDHCVIYMNRNAPREGGEEELVLCSSIPSRI